ncbi:MAG: GntR family transcriptional regulator [Naasia sp.]|jgi:DNA-binding transcriptional regulator YhcF (GntR family)|uniref:GntR family transcriptional regulator n=1 Tax=Naasia sp. TaxID=2546198 RepID=UPI002628E352|nr:GntR family transcriptional regulator [Naasia sp.]MCU1570213.1 GntR family transcriptional regulator [Naasia sp.]
MTPHLAVDPTDPTPPYEQLRRQLLQQITSGELPALTRLPPVRTLAESLGLAPGTVARAYRELEQDGLLQTRGRLGTVVAPSPDPVAGPAAVAAAAFADRIRSLGVDDDEALRLVRGALAARPLL